MDSGSAFFKVTKNNLYGRYLVAKQPIKQGQLILKEAPLMVAPPLGGPMICFNCCTSLKKAYLCSNCNIAVLCKPGCTAQLHNSEECTILKTLSIKGEDILENPEIITPLRCLLWRRYKPEVFNSLLALEAHLEERRDTEIWRNNKINIESVLVKLNIINTEDLSEELVQRICGVFDVNTFELPRQQYWRPRGLYSTAALMAHDCIANTHLAVDEDFVLYIHAAVDIPQDYPIYFNYTNTLQDGNERRRFLLEGKYFHCECARCGDSTEMGTEIGSIICPKCRKGFIRLESNGWQCSECLHLYSASLIKTTIEEARRRIFQITNSGQTSDNLLELEKLLSKLNLTFHPQHFLILEIEQNLIGLYTKTALSKKNLFRRIELCRKLLAVFAKLEPGISRTQAMILYQLHTVLVNLAQKEFNSQEIDGEEFILKLNVAENTLKESIKYLLYEPTKSPEGRLAQSALSDLKMLRLSISNVQKKTLLLDIPPTPIQNSPRIKSKKRKQ